ncbi:MAG: SH3 domain-containing protein [Aquificaceae bacterium]|nr:SH3 domain-containing protein [Aquificaceae bacterium]
MSWLILLIVLNLTFGLDVSRISLQSYTFIDHMKRVEELPLVLEGRKVREWMREDKLPEGRLFIDNREMGEKDLEMLLEEMNLEGLGELVVLRHGWTLRRTNMRMYPTDRVIHKGNPRIDYNQYTLLEPFTPLAILHTSKDGNWLYLQAPYMRGWVRKEDVHQTDRESLLKLREMPFLVVTEGKLNIGKITFGLGSKVPYLAKDGKRYKVLLPDGTSLWVRKGYGLEEGHPAFSEEKARSILESLLDTPYDWGGKEGRWDCSSLVQSLYAVFGAELPRNSAQQAKIGRVVASGFSSYQEFKNLLKTLPPFRTLLFMKGHVMLYGGMEGGDIVIYHSVYRMTKEDGSKWFIGAIRKNYVEREGLRNLYRSLVSVNVLD